MLPGLLSVLIFFPALGALALLLLRADDHVWIRRFAMFISVIEFIFSLLLLWKVPISAPGYSLAEFHTWISSPPINYHVGVDGLSLFLVLLTTFLTPISVLASWSSINHRVKEFFIMLLMLEVGVIGVFLSLDLFLFFLFWEVMLIPMAFLIGIWGHDRRIYAAVKFVIYTMAGSILMLVGIVWLYHATGTFDLPRIQEMLAAGTPQLVDSGGEMLLFLAFFVAFAIKVPLFPLHTWLPDAHVEAPTAGSVMLAGVLLKMGTYGMMRFCLPLFPDSAHRAAPYIAVLAIIGIIYGALVAMVQPNLKKLVAYSSVSHLGFVVLGIFAFHNISMQGAVYQMLAHGISTGALFLLVGMLYDRKHTFEISEFGGLATPDAEAGGVLFVCRAFFARPADPERVRRRISDSAGHLPIALGMGLVGGSRRDSLRVLLALVLPAGVFRRNHSREKQDLAGCFCARALDSDHHGYRHAVDGRGLGVHHPTDSALVANGDRASKSATPL